LGECEGLAGPYVERLLPQRRQAAVEETEREFFIDNLLVRVKLIIAMMRSTGLALWEFEFPFPGSLTSTFLGYRIRLPQISDARLRQEKYSPLTMLQVYPTHKKHLPPGTLQ
jgi:hypothetical protein